MSAPRATVAPLDTPAIAELAQLDQWVISKPVRRRGKLDKPPFSPILDANHSEPWMCSHSDPSHWSSYDTARAALHGFAWLGFVFHESDPYSGIDLDGCRDPQTGVIEGWAQRIIDLAQSYTEISPSGAGVKIFVRGTLADTLLHSMGAHKGIEVYSVKRYFTVTGLHLAGTPTEIRNAQSALDQLQQELKPDQPPKVERAIGVIKIAPRASSGRASLADVKARFNAEHTLDSLLTGYGAVKTKDGYSCPFCTHPHETTLYISKQGRLFSYSPNCKLHTTKGYDAFGLYVLIDHNDNALAAAKKLNPIEPRQKRQDPPLVEPTPARVQTSEQAQDAQRKRDARKAAAATTIADVQARASQDNTLTDADRAVLKALIAIANGRAWCRPSKERLAEESEYSLGSVKRSLMLLEDRGYFRSEGVGGGSNQTAIRTFLRGSLAGAETSEMIHEFIENIDLIQPLELVSAAQPAQPEAEPGEWEYWQPAEWECSVYDLALELPQTFAEPSEPTPATVPSEPPAEAAPITIPQDAPPLVEPPAPIWRVASDKRGMWFLRGSAGECIVFGRDEGAARQALAAMTPASPEQPHQDAPISTFVETVPAGPQAFYDPGAALQLGGEYTGKPKHYADFETRWAWSSEAIKPRASSPTVINALDPRFAEQDDPQVRSAPIEPAAADRYWKLRGKAKHAKSSAQRSLLNRQADELMIWRSASDVHAARSERQESAIAPPSQAPARRAAVAQQGAFL